MITTPCRATERCRVLRVDSSTVEHLDPASSDQACERSQLDRATSYWDGDQKAGGSTPPPRTCAGSSAAERLDPRVQDVGGSSPSPHTSWPESSAGAEQTTASPARRGREPLVMTGQHDHNPDQTGVQPDGEGSGSACRKVPGSSPGQATNGRVTQAGRVPGVMSQEVASSILATPISSSPSGGPNRVTASAHNVALGDLGSDAADGVPYVQTVGNVEVLLTSNVIELHRNNWKALPTVHTRHVSDCVDHLSKRLAVSSLPCLCSGDIVRNIPLVVGLTGDLRTLATVGTEAP